MKDAFQVSKQAFALPKWVRELYVWQTKFVHLASVKVDVVLHLRTQNVPTGNAAMVMETAAPTSAILLVCAIISKTMVFHA